METQAEIPEFEPTAAGAAVGLVLVLASIALFPLGRALALRLFPRRNVIFARWGFFHVGLAIFTYFTLTILGGMLLRAAGVSLSGGIAPVVFGALLQVATVALCFVFARRLDPEGIAALGFRSGGNVRALGVGVLAYGFGIPAIMGAMLLSAWSWKALGVEAPPQEVLKLVLELEGAERVVFVLLAVALIPLCEELFFRGYLTQQLAARIPHPLVWGLLPSLAFGLAHTANGGGDTQFAIYYVAVATLLGLVMTALVWRTGGLAAAMGFHLMNNIGAMLMIGIAGVTPPISLFVMDYSTMIGSASTDVLVLGLLLAFVLSPFAPLPKGQPLRRK